VQRWWSFLFGAVMIAATASFIVAPVFGWWLPPNVSTFGPRVDALFYIILGITGFFFILTESILVYFMYKYAGELGGRRQVYQDNAGAPTSPSALQRLFRPVTAIIHDQHRLELAWTIVPAVILLFIAFVQVNTWEEIKYLSRMPKPDQQPLQIEVSARQFEWRIRYPSPERLRSWEKDAALAKDFGTKQGKHEDDVYIVNEVHTWKDQKVLVHLTTRDVIHSFYLPNLRLKQDALPGKTIPVWFEAVESNTTREGSDRWVDGGGFDPKTKAPKDPAKVWELACAELCGWGHYKMIGRLYVHDSRDDFFAWLEQARKNQNLTQPPENTATASR
jgi:cytochrome c oxidase subunit 2